MNTAKIRSASPQDIASIQHILRSEGLPTVGVAEHVRTFLIAEQEGNTIGAIGLEVYGEVALLRSAVVVRTEQNKGVGGLLYNALLRHARSIGIQRLVLLTNTAEEYFGKEGFRTVPQTTVTGPITASVEFTGACPSHAVCMELTL